jgi:hypothetical protein
MGYVDLARSHVKECLREAFELPQLVVDEDGDVPFTHGTAQYYVTVRQDGRKAKAWSTAVFGVKPVAAVLREINEVNAGLQHARVFVSRERLVVEGVLPIDGLTPDDLRELCLEVGTVADEVGQMISAVHGGVVAVPEGEGGCDHCGS